MNIKNENRPTVLIVDDTPDNITLLANLLKDKYNTKVATSGATALQIVAGAKIDLVLLDIMMPEMDGFEACRRLKADPHSSAIPVVFLTAKSQPEDEAMGRSVGAVDFLRKPVNPDQLFARVAAHLR
ncbi:response regulator [Duganella sp. CT11-25]|jgi:CheY-like chemotaxis protein|uniref:response regulator n=1 Tax=unclassified Duganella TaxID=2636909 RepID=UPI0039AF7D0D